LLSKKNTVDKTKDLGSYMANIQSMQDKYQVENPEGESKKEESKDPNERQMA
jgi:nuclear GTP-binding protein